MISVLVHTGPRGGKYFGVKLVNFPESLGSETLTCLQLRYIIAANIQAKN